MRKISGRTHGRQLRPKTAVREGAYEWERESIRQREESPFCYDPLERHLPKLVAGSLRHHVIPVSVAPWLLMDPANTRTLCQDCHNAVEAMLSKGERVRALFEASDEERVQQLISLSMRHLARARRCGKSVMSFASVMQEKGDGEGDL